MIEIPGLVAKFPLNSHAYMSFNGKAREQVILSYLKVFVALHAPKGELKEKAGFWGFGAS